MKIQYQLLPLLQIIINTKAMTTSFGLPQFDQHQWALNMNQFPFSQESVMHRSPTLPLHFNKKYLPKNLCETELLNTSQCLLQYNYSQNNKKEMCAFQFSHFEMCRRKRDARIFQSIKLWEEQHFKGLDQTNKGMYKMGLNRKLTRLQDEYSRQPSTIKGISKAKGLQFEIKQLKWRLGNIKLFEQPTK